MRAGHFRESVELIALVAILLIRHGGRCGPLKSAGSVAKIIIVEDAKGKQQENIKFLIIPRGILVFCVNNQSVIKEYSRLRIKGIFISSRFI